MQAVRSRSGNAEHIPEGVNPAPATRRKDLVSQDTKSFFAYFSVFAVDGTIGI